MPLKPEQKEKILKAQQLIQDLLEELPKEGGYQETWISSALKQADRSLNTALLRNSMS